MILLFENHTLDIDANSSIVMNTSEGFPLQEILFNGFDFRNTEKRVASPISTNSINSDTFTKHFKTLFNTNFLQLIQSTYFGPQELRPSSLEKYPIYKTFADVVPRQEDAQPELDGFIMKMALSSFMTNFGNIWNSSARFTSLFNHLLLVLLRLHLTPRREREKNNFIKQEIDKAKDKRETRTITTEDIEPIPINKISLINLTRDQKQNLFDSERRKYIQYINRAELELENLDNKAK